MCAVRFLSNVNEVCICEFREVSLHFFERCVRFKFLLYLLMEFRRGFRMLAGETQRKDFR